MSKETKNTLLDRELKGFEYWSKRGPVGRNEEKVGVFGHGDPGQQLEAQSVFGFAERTCEEVASVGSSEQREPTFAGECYKSDATRNLAAGHVFADGMWTIARI